MKKRQAKADSARKRAENCKASLAQSAFLSWDPKSPLAARMRPQILDEFVGQGHILSEGKLLRRAIQADRLGSLIFSGPPGSGKTTLARVIANVTDSAFESLNAVFAGVKDIRAVVERARERLDHDILGRPQRTTLFVDEVHRFNKAQQDALLPHVENGVLTFIGATTENPYFEVIKALVSRSRIFELQSLSDDEVVEVLRRALSDEKRGYGQRCVEVDEDALLHLAKMAQGDARNALNALELAVETTTPGSDETVRVDMTVAEESIQRRALLYDKDGDAHYDTISAFIKSLRGSDPDAALYWMAKMIAAGEDPRFIARRMVIFASEDVGLADPLALQVVTAAAHAVEYVGLPECQYSLAQACLHLALAPKSNSTMGYFTALRQLEDGASADVPNHLKDASRDRKGLGHGVGYKYPPAFRDHWVAQQYLPGGLQGTLFYEPGDQGYEKALAERVTDLRQRQSRTLAAFDEALAGRDELNVEKRALERAFGRASLQLAEQIICAATLDKLRRVLVLGRSRLLTWALLENHPLVKIYATSTEMEEAKADYLVATRAGLQHLSRPLAAESGCLPLETDSLDGVFGWRLFGRTTDRARLATELVRVLKHGGELALGERAEDEGNLTAELQDAGFGAVELRSRGGALLVYARKN